MTLFFPDLNVWTALSVAGHSHSEDAWKWLTLLTNDARLVFCRYTQLGLLRMLTNRTVMGGQTLTLKQAWAIYDRWLDDPRVEIYPEPRDLDSEFRTVTAPFAGEPATKWIGDGYLLAYAARTDAHLVTFDRALYAFATKHHYAAILPQ